MGVAYTCVLIAALMPYVLVWYAKFSTKGYDNKNPRDFLISLDGAAKRASAAHLNCFEAFPAFAASVIIAHAAGVSIGFINFLSLLFIFFRILYCLFYIINQSTLRSLVWLFGLICVVTLFIAAIAI